jgi:hypothetical protein
MLTDEQILGSARQAIPESDVTFRIERVDPRPHVRTVFCDLAGAAYARRIEVKDDATALDLENLLRIRAVLDEKRRQLAR